MKTKILLFAAGLSLGFAACSHEDRSGTESTYDDTVSVSDSLTTNSADNTGTVGNSSAGRLSSDSSSQEMQSPGNDSSDMPR